MKIAIGSDHAGFELKEFIKKQLTEVSFIDVGAYSEERVDYPDYAKKVCSQINEKNVDLGFLICGTGTGMAISANKVSGIRAACCMNEMVAELSRKHNDANVLTVGARVTGVELALRISQIFIHTEFEKGRHQIRVDKIEKEV